MSFVRPAANAGACENDRCRVAPVPVRTGEGPLTERGAGAQQRQKGVLLAPFATFVRRRYRPMTGSREQCNSLISVLLNFIALATAAVEDRAIR